MKEELNEQQRNNAAENRAGETNEKPVTVEILRHRQLFNILRNPRSLWKFLGLLLVLVVLIFFVLAGVSLIIKRYYPYNDINTNIYGATTLKNEDKDVTYWLFNTAEMWGNSGIHVKENDMLTIRTSGAWHTAIHHLVDDAKSNSMLSEAWFNSDGGIRNAANDQFRAQFRVSPSDMDAVLLMAVFPEDAQNGRQGIADASEGDYNKNFINAIDSSRCEIHRIGRERLNIRMLSSGVLHFSVNDIVLTRQNIKKMYSQFVETLPDSLISKDSKRTVLDWVTEWNPESAITVPTHILKIDSDMKAKSIVRDQKGDSIGINYPEIKFGGYPNRDPKGWLLDNELIYYYNNRFYDAWFIDNIGSALIIIEHKHSEKQ